MIALSTQTTNRILFSGQHEEQIAPPQEVPGQAHRIFTSFFDPFNVEGFVPPDWVFKQAEDAEEIKQPTNLVAPTNTAKKRALPETTTIEKTKRPKVDKPAANGTKHLHYYSTCF